MSQEEEGGEEGEEEDKHSFFPTNNSENMKLEMLEQFKQSDCWESLLEGKYKSPRMESEEEEEQEEEKKE